MASQEIELTAFRINHKFRQGISTADSLNVTAKKCALLMAEYIVKNVATHSVEIDKWKQIADEIKKL